MAAYMHSPLARACWTKPLRTSLSLQTMADLGRSKSELIAENALLRLYWKRKSKAASRKPKIAEETIALIREMAANNRLWGAERIRGELLKLGLRVCKRTVQKYMRGVRTQQPGGQKWTTFLRNHAAQVWACDFLPVTDLFFRSLFAFCIVELKSRRVI